MAPEIRLLSQVMDTEPNPPCTARPALAHFIAAAAEGASPLR
jgi:hypothetical protein